MTLSLFKKFFILLVQFSGLFTLDNPVSVKLNEYLVNQNFSGVVLISKNDNEILFKKAFGYANYEFEILNDTEKIKFLIGSNTKTFIAVSIMLLVQKEMLSVDDLVSKYIKDFPANITIHHLLTHTSGIENFYRQFEPNIDCTNLDQVVDKVETWDVRFTPGSKFEYSNAGYQLLAYIIEKVSKKRFDLFVQENICAPLGMTNTGSVAYESIIPYKASGYEVVNGIVFQAPSIHCPISLAGCGDLYSTLEDMNKWMQGLFSGKVINQENLHMLQFLHVQMEGSENRFHAYGLFIDKRYGRMLVEYSGAIRGYLSKIIRFTDKNNETITIQTFTNKEDMDQFENMCDELEKIVFIS